MDPNDNIEQYEDAVELDEGRASRLARSVVADVSDVDRAALLKWAEDLLEIRHSQLPAVRKAGEALRRTASTDAANAV